jgi:excisionase family DNA binding protein
MNNFKENLQSKQLEVNEHELVIKAWLTGDEICKLLRVSKRTLQNYRDKRVIPFSQIGRKIYYKYSDIVDYLELHYVKPYYQKGGIS